MEQNPQVISLVVFAGIAWLAFKVMRFGRRDKTLPPGPPTIPVLGNLHLLPLRYPFLRFSEWGKQYGGILSLKIANATFIVISDMKVVRELLDDRSSETSSRPFFYALHTIVKGNFFPLAPSDNPIWRTSRKSIQPFLSAQAVHSHMSIVEQETTQLLYDILHSPDNVCSHVFRFTFSSIASLAFGKRVPQHDSPVATQFQEYLRNFLKTVSPETAPVDLVPVLRYIPEFLAPWMKLWRETRRQQQSLYFSFLEHTEHGLNSGNRSGSIIETVLEQRDELGLSREMVAYMGGVLLDAGTETTATTIQSLLLCLIKCPTSLKKAQEEIDDLIGNTRLPIASDIDALPYIQAIIKEVHRFRPVVPTGVPHAAVNDCQYRGYTIPKGSPILINVWGILHDPDLFERPDEFWPERYLLTPDGTMPGLNKDYNIRASLPFGSGKRLCPGIHFGSISLNVAVMRLLWAFDFAPDEKSAQIGTWNIAEEYVEGITLTPKNFGCKIAPRDIDKIKIIEDSYKQTSQLG